MRKVERMLRKSWRNRNRLDAEIGRKNGEVECCLKGEIKKLEGEEFCVGGQTAAGKGWRERNVGDQ